MNVYEVECRAVITLAAQDMQQAALRGPAVIKDNPHLIYVRAVHERNFQMIDAITLKEVRSTEEPKGGTSKSKAPTWAKMTARSMTFRSSRMLPGQS